MTVRCSCRAGTARGSTISCVTIRAPSRCASCLPRLHITEERGSGSLLALSIVACLVLVVGLIVPVAGALLAKQRVASSADAAALAAANTVSGRVTGFACERAEEIGSLTDTEIRECTVTGAVVTVVAASRYLIFDVVARARAGPPGSR